MDLLSAVVNGVSMGAIYGLIALGLTLIFGIMKIINFAHGALLMLSMMTSYWIWKITGLNPYLLIILLVPIMFVFGYITQRVFIKPVLDRQKDVREPISVLLLTAALAMVFENFALMTFGGDYVMAKTAVSDATLVLGGVTLSAARFYALIIALIIATIFYVFLQYSELGRKLRACGQDRNTAALMGIDVPNTYAIAFGIGTALLAVAAITLIPFYYVHPTVGEVFMTKAFIVVVLGGLGSVPGAIVGGIIIGLIESIGAQYMTATLTTIVVYLIFLLVLFVKPSGLFGSRFEW
ncbi:MAG: branched-chain amino acid ABC transporter permease [Syntrophomonadaceae bacterium]|nr:branched-chain amino acid ABC transporter permease [Syntrophomonadaceae bacterium]